MSDQPKRTGSMLGYVWLLLGLAVLLATLTVAADDFIHRLQIELHALYDNRALQWAGIGIGAVLTLLGIATLPRKR